MLIKIYCTHLLTYPIYFETTENKISTYEFKLYLSAWVAYNSLQDLYIALSEVHVLWLLVINAIKRMFQIPIWLRYSPVPYYITWWDFIIHDNHVTSSLLVPWFIQALWLFLWNQYVPEKVNNFSPKHYASRRRRLPDDVTMTP